MTKRKTPGFADWQAELIREADIEREIERLEVFQFGHKEFIPERNVASFLETVATYAALEKLRSKPCSDAKWRALNAETARIVGIDAVRRELGV